MSDKPHLECASEALRSKQFGGDGGALGEPPPNSGVRGDGVADRLEVERLRKWSVEPEPRELALNLPQSSALERKPTLIGVAPAPNAPTAVTGLQDLSRTLGARSTDTLSNVPSLVLSRSVREMNAMPRPIEPPKLDLSRQVDTLRGPRAQRRSNVFFQRVVGGVMLVVGVIGVLAVAVHLSKPNGPYSETTISATRPALPEVPTVAPAPPKKNPVQVSVAQSSLTEAKHVTPTLTTPAVPQAAPAKAESGMKPLQPVRQIEARSTRDSEPRAAPAAAVRASTSPVGGRSSPAQPSQEPWFPK